MSCSFCGKGREQVRKIIAGPAVQICDECVLLCMQILVEESPPEPRYAWLASGQQLLVRVADGRMHAARRTTPWWPFSADGEALEWCVAESAAPATLVCVRAPTRAEQIAGAAYPRGTELTEERAREVNARLRTSQA